jgi:hypothetical protein
VGRHFTHAVAEAILTASAKMSRVISRLRASRIDFPRNISARCRAPPTGQTSSGSVSHSAPAAEPTLFFLYHGAERCTDGTETVAPLQNDGTVTGCAVRHRGRAAAAFTGRLE